MYLISYLRNGSIVRKFFSTLEEACEAIQELDLADAQLYKMDLLMEVVDGHYTEGSLNGVGY